MSPWKGCKASGTTQCQTKHIPHKTWLSCAHFIAHLKSTSSIPHCQPYTPHPIASMTNKIATQAQEHLPALSSALVAVRVQWCMVNRARTITMLPAHRTIQIQLFWLVLRWRLQKDIHTLKNIQKHKCRLLPYSIFLLKHYLQGCMTDIALSTSHTKRLAMGKNLEGSGASCCIQTCFQGSAGFHQVCQGSVGIYYVWSTSTPNVIFWAAAWGACALNHAAGRCWSWRK